MPKLKKCPRCNKRKSVIKSKNQEINFIYYVECLPCIYKGPEFNSPDDAIKYWNIR